MYTTSYILFLAFAEYVLMRPSEDYAPFMNAVYEKICMSKVRFLLRPFHTNVKTCNKALLKTLEH